MRPPTGVVEVDVRRDDPVHGLARETQRLQRAQQPRHREVGAGVDEGRPAVLHQQVGGVEALAVEAGVDDMDAVAQGLQVGRQGHPGIVGSGWGCRVLPGGLLRTAVMRSAAAQARLGARLGCACVAWVGCRNSVVGATRSVPLEQGTAVGRDPRHTPHHTAPA